MKATETDIPLLTNRFSIALDYASRMYALKVCPNGTPYISHALAVASLVLENHAKESTAIAALLCFTDEPFSRSFLVAEFGAKVANLVDYLNLDESLRGGVSTTKYIAQLQNAPKEAVLISAASLLHTLRSMGGDVESLSFDIASFYYALVCRVYSPYLGDGCKIVTELETLFVKKLMRRMDKAVIQEPREGMQEARIVSFPKQSHPTPPLAFDPIHQRGEE